MNSKHKAILNQGLALVKSHREVEFALLLNLQQVKASGLYKELGKKNIFEFVTEVWGFSRGHAYGLMKVADRCAKIPSLGEALRSQQLTVYGASRLMPILNEENAEELLRFAATHTSEEVDEEVAGRRPKPDGRASFKRTAKDRIAVKATISKEIYAKLQRAMSVLAQKKARHVEFEEAFGEMLEVYLERHDPVQKAERASRKVRVPNSEISYAKPGRTPLTAEQKHAVNLRDQGRCTHIDAEGKRCDQDRWTQIHHIVHVEYGGTNAPENLTTLCSFHHDLVHQLVFTMEQGEANCLRAPRSEYRAH